jgi:hypothetical protein
MKAIRVYLRGVRDGEHGLESDALLTDESMLTLNENKEGKEICKNYLEKC